MQFDYIKQGTFFGLLVATTVLFLWMLGDYLFPVFWAIVVAIVFYPLFSYLNRKLKGRSTVAALLSVLLVILIIMVPLSIIGGMVVNESLSLYKEVTSDQAPAGLNLLERTSVLSVYLEPFGVSPSAVESRLTTWTTSALSSLTQSLLVFSQSTFSFLISIIVMVYLLFFMFKDGAKLEKILYHYLPLGDAHERLLVERFTATTRAVVKGTLAIAVLQGALGGIAFAIAGVSAPTLWGVAMTLLAVIPAIGPGLIWLPAGLILLLTGSVWQGIFILIVGALLVSVIDNFLRPVLIGRETKMPDAVILLSTLGGLATFGISGFIVGPIIAAFFLSLWTIFEKKFHRELTNNE
jgi:predicted PurR-regulated permease PerM